MFKEDEIYFRRSNLFLKKAIEADEKKEYKKGQEYRRVSGNFWKEHLKKDMEE